MISKSVQLEQDFYKAIDGFIIARFEELLGRDDPGISLTSAREALQRQIRILCNEACKTHTCTPESVYGPLPIRPVNIPIVSEEINFELGDIFKSSFGHGSAKVNTDIITRN